MISYWGVEHGDEISKGFLDSKTAKIITYGGSAAGIGTGAYLAASPKARGKLDAKNKASGANAFGFGATHKYNRKTKTWDKKVSKARVPTPKPIPMDAAGIYANRARRAGVDPDRLSRLIRGAPPARKQGGK